MKIPDAYIARGNELGVPGNVPQYPLQVATNKYDRMQGMGHSITNVGGALLRLNTSLNQARQQVRTDELSMQMQDGLTQAAKNYSETEEAGGGSGSLVRNAPNLKKFLDQTSQTFIDSLEGEDEKVLLGLKHNSMRLQQGIYNESVAAFGKRDAEYLKGTFEQTTAKEIGAISVMPWGVNMEGMPDISTFTRDQESALAGLNQKTWELANKTGLLYKDDVDRIAYNSRMDAALKAGQFFAESSPENARHALELYRKGKPIYGITDRNVLKPIAEAARNTFVNAIATSETDYKLAQRAVGEKSDASRKQYLTVIDAHPDVNILSMIDNDPELTESDRSYARTQYLAAQEHKKSGPANSDPDTLAMIGADLGQLMFGGDTKAMRNKIVANQSHLKAEHLASFLKEVTDAEVNQRTLSRAKSSAYVKDLYGNGKSFLQQISGLVMGSPETDEHKAYSVLGKITEKVILNPDMTPSQVDEAFYPILREAYGTLSKPKQNIPAMQSWINKMPDTGKAGAAKRSFNDILKQQIDIIEKRKTEAEAAAKQYDPSKLEPKEPWEFQKTYKDLTDKLKKAWEGK